MKTFIETLRSISTHPIAVLDTVIPINEYVPLNLSKDNVALAHLNITNYNVCQNYIDTVLSTKKGSVGYGGYLEERNLYNDKNSFVNGNAPMRNIHLGIDFWCDAFTKVVTPLKGTVHSFKFNNTIGDYGPTIVLKHIMEGYSFYTLYGHLSLNSLDGLFVGKVFEMGEQLGKLGTPDINVNYAPHLHFQIIRDMEGHYGDYPGVCAKERLNFFRQNCPDPNILLKLN